MLVSRPAPAARMTKISAAWRYSSGAGHFAYDYAMPAGTELYAVRDGVVLDCSDGVVDTTPHAPGNYPGQAGSGSPSNWVLLRVRYKGRYATVYYQHLKSVAVRKGEKVKAGQVIGRAGSTGNATGAHLHIATMWGGNHNVYTRYAYMMNDGRNDWVIWTPARLWSTADFVRASNVVRGKRNEDILQVQKALRELYGLDYSSAPGLYGPRTAEKMKQAEADSGKTGLALIAWIGAKASRANGFNAIR